ncbi:1,2-phenylacetyl-CoA epoxidase subunit PaaC [Hoeflea sp. EC-HK425]|uniref:1,2-phenylacetyl-CoA epoxidase subunit PaaC n=1 Tax=Hoeflea sp. EC-HK425 TaxID=2038388 RepID=UPI001259285A|nr:1,2-phenylacetyl-CoA epoxidase subunit PaaC [Hoeflea sp. EC-HK425]VVT09187.1 putative multicomponent oxygenase/reductase subunit for phenylacetic acid degradation [Hoeflea sp. EC-HK425]|tara:strand:- start:213 stop:974 length:762 start_codon:yes stop_codon:yes gene_type:complete
MAAPETCVPAILEIADDCLILGHRLSEWCGHAPILEEELALANMGLDLLGQASALYAHAGKLEGKGRSEDDFAFLRREREYVNCLLVERENRDFAHTMLRQLYFAAFMQPFWRAIAATSSDETLRGIAAKAEKEMAYHLRHSGEWVIRMGDGSDESAARMADAVIELHRYTGELFMASPARAAAIADGLLPDPDTLRAEWDETVATVFNAAKLELPEIRVMQKGGRDGNHGEDMGHLLAELQFMQRAYPGHTW